MAKKMVEEDTSGDWMATYADLVTLLLCFFVLLFSMSNVDAGKYSQVAASMAGRPLTVVEAGGTGILPQMGTGITDMIYVKGEGDSSNVGEGQQVESELEKMASDFKTYFAEHNLEEKVDIEVGSQSIHLRFDDGMFFDSGLAVIKPEAKEVVIMIGKALEDYPGSDISIEGHTDNRPINTFKFPNNMYLSNARAAEVAIFLIEEMGIEPYRVSTEGFGEYRPIGDNQEAAGRALNRRVEINILSEHYSNKNEE